MTAPTHNATHSDGAQMFANRLHKNLRHLGRWLKREHIHCYRLYDAEDKVDFRAEVHEHAITGPFADALTKATGMEVELFPVGSRTAAVEALKAEPDQLLAYALWAEDADARGQTRRTFRFARRGSSATIRFAICGRKTDVDRRSVPGITGSGVMQKTTCPSAF